MIINLGYKRFDLTCYVKPKAKLGKKSKNQKLVVNYRGAGERHSVRNATGRPHPPATSPEGEGEFPSPHGKGVRGEGVTSRLTLYT
jgi:hypothetical protein